MRKTRISHVRFRVQTEEPTPQELIESYLKGTKETAKETYQHLNEAVPDVDTVIEKIIKPRIKGTQAFLNPEAVTRTGTKIKDIPPPTWAELVRQAQRWLKKVKYTHRYDGKEYIESIKNMAEYYAKEMTRLVLPFRGYKDKIRGVAPIVAQWLTAVLTVVKRVSREEVIEGGPIDITKPGQRGNFRNRLNSQVLSFGSQIIKKNYLSSEIIYANEHINRLVTAFASNKFVSFTPGGDSHVDFIREDQQLFLEVQVSVVL